MIACPSCNAEQSDTSLFCSQCGAALSPEIAATIVHEAVRSPSDSSGHSSTSDSHHGRFLPGTKISGRYRIVSLVGKGGMGEVYRADDLKLGHTVALKFLPENLDEDPQRLEYFLSEVRLTRQISHPNVCRVYDVGEIDGQHFLSMEYIDGEDLSVLLRRIGKLPFDKGIEIAQQLCAGLAAAHDKGVLHRDLKPANIMLDGRGKVRVTDFGLAKLATESTEGEIAGTPAYMAPEQLIGGRITIQSDLFALGLILYEFFTGKPARKPGSLTEIIRDIEESSLSHTLKFPVDFDSAVEHAVTRCLKSEPHERPVSAAAVAASLPGGDPLAAALAAGETPSPELVATAGGSGVLSIGHAAIYLAVVLVGLVALIPLRGAVSPSVAVTESAEVFAGSARDLLKELQYDRARYEQYQFGLAEDEVSHQKTIDFWYRQSSVGLIPEQTPVDFFSRRSGTRLTNPPPLTEGMVSIVLNAAKELRQFYVVPSLNRTKPEWLAELDTQKFQQRTKNIKLVFEKAGLKLTSDGQLKFKDERATAWTASVSEHRAPFDVDEWFVFETGEFEHVQAGKDQPAIERVELGLAEGAIVYFNVAETSIRRGSLSPWHFAPKPPKTWSDFKTTWNAYRAEAAMPADQIDEVRAKEKFDEAWDILVKIVSTGINVISRAVSFLTLPLTMILAWWNVKLGRSDRRVAWRIAAFLFFVVLLRARFEFGLTLEMFRSSLQLSAGVAFKFWVYYLALEPILRKFWPGCLTVWSRAMIGRWQDPSLGHSLLVGAAMSTVVPLLHALLVGQASEFDPLPLSGNAALITSLLQFIQFIANWGFYILIVLVICRFAARRDSVAVVIAPLALIAFYHTGEVTDPSLFLIVLAVYYGTLMVLLIRFGVVAVFSFLICHHLLVRMPIADGLGPDLTPTVVVILTILLIAGYGFYISVGGRKPLIAKLST